MKISLYDIYLLITKDRRVNFGIAGFQINNILNIGTKIFMKKKKVEIIEI